MLLRLLLLLTIPLLLAGCAGHGHENNHHVGGGPIPAGVLVGVENKADRAASATLALLAANGTVLWSEDLTVPAQGNPERHRELAEGGNYTVEVTVRWTAGGRESSLTDRAVVDTTECAGLSHLTFVIEAAGEGFASTGVHRECHE